jgi:anti-sigma factor RsiW
MGYEDGELSGDERQEFDRHLAVCPSCVNYLQTYRKTTLMARASANAAVPDEVPEELVKAILAARQKPQA